MALKFHFVVGLFVLIIIRVQVSFKSSLGFAVNVIFTRRYPEDESLFTLVHLPETNRPFYVGNYRSHLFAQVSCKVQQTKPSLSYPFYSLAYFPLPNQIQDKSIDKKINELAASHDIPVNDLY